MVEDLLTIRARVPVVAARWVPFATGFRIFFLAGAVGALFPVALWIDVYGASQIVALPWLPSMWHGHEMIYGFAMAVVIGFLTTAVPKWTSTTAASGTPVVVLFAAWLAGRLAMCFAGTLSSTTVMVASLSVYPVLLMIIGRPILATANRRNYGFPVLVLVLALGDALTHLPRLGYDATWGYHGTRLGLFVLTMMVTLVGGRIVPVFTNAALQREGRGPVISESPRWDMITPLVVAAALVSQLVGAPHELAVPLLTIAAGLLTLRVIRYRPWVARNNPLLWILHVGYAWLPVGLLCLAATRMGIGIAESTALHGLATGAVGCMILAMIARVSLGHTGRSLELPRGMVGAFLAIVLAAVLRVFAVTVAPEHLGELVIAASILWLGGFAMFVVRYAGMLTRPRVDGRPG